MSMIKTPEEIERLAESGALLSRALQAAIDAVRPGVTMKELDAIAEQVIVDGGGEPSFKGYKGGGSIPFPSTVCISRNDEIVHGIGTREIPLESGDIVGLDIGCWLHGLCTDMAVTVPVGSISEERKTLLRLTRDSLMNGIDAAIIGNTVADIGGAVEDTINKKKYGIVRALVGHGVGHAVHEEPHVPNFRSRQFPAVDLKEGMVLAIEPMITTGDDDVMTADDGWTITTVDGSDAAHFELTIAITKDGPRIITPVPTVQI